VTNWAAYDIALRQRGSLTVAAAFRKPFHASDGPFWSGGLRRAVP
jgi:hypothetical protein